MLNWQLTKLDEVAPSPWRNGGGVTRQLASWPPGAESWCWRMAVAEVAQDGPFSLFAGVTRWFSVLSGGGVQLSSGGRTHRLTGASVPLCFDGGVPTDCRLLAGATLDFNLMVRGDPACARMTRIAGTLEVVLDVPKTVAVYAIAAPACVDFAQRSLLVSANCLAWQTLPAGVSLRVRAAGALWIEIETSRLTLLEGK